MYSYFCSSSIIMGIDMRTMTSLCILHVPKHRTVGNSPTLSFYNNESSKNKHFLILLSSLARNSQEHKLKRIFEIPWVLFEKSLILYFDWPKSWIWLTLEKVMNTFCKWHLLNASKEVFWQKKILNFMHGFKSAILAKMKNCQNGTFEPVHEIQNFFLPQDFFWGIMKVPFIKKYS